MLHEMRRARVCARTRTTAERQGGLRRFVLPALWLVCIAADAGGAELGNITVHSWLGRQLKASVVLTGDDARENEARCFKAAILNSNREVISSLKVSLQHSSKSSVLLLTGGNAINEPAATILLENSCGTGARREYALLFDPSPDGAAVAATSPAMDLMPQPEPGKSEVVEQPASAANTETPVTRSGAPAKRLAENAGGKITVRKPGDSRTMPDFIPRVTGMFSLKMTAMIADPLGERIVQTSDASGRSEMPGIPGEATPIGTESGPFLKFDRSLSGMATRTVNENRASRNGLIASIVSILAMIGAGIWIAMRVRDMRTASQPWAPIDTVLDTGEEGQKPNSPTKA